MHHYRTPDAAFEALPDFPFEPHYLEWNGLRVHHLDEGAADAPVMLLMHGEPTWSYLYRNWIPTLVAAGFRVIVPDRDACYVALAEAIGCPLLTADQRLAAAPGPRCPIEVV